MRRRGIVELTNRPIHRRRRYLENQLEEQTYSRKRHNELRLFALKYYGGKCACCGFDDLSKKIRGQSFLTIDTVAGSGKAEHKRHPSTYAYLRKVGYPTGYRVLCWPCNVGMEPGELICELHKWESAR